MRVKERSTGGAQLTVILLFLSFSYGINLFQRYSPAVLFSHASWSVPLSELQIGYIGSIFFYCYAAMLLFAGVIADRLGSRVSLGAGLLLMAAGNLLFAVGGNEFFLLAAGRGLVGIGSALITIPVFKVAREVFPPERYGTHVGVITTGGHIGTITASLPFAWLLAFFRWQQLYYAFFILTAAAAGVLMLITRQGAGAPAPKERITRHDLAVLLKKGRMWVLAVWMLMFTGSKLAFQGMWAGVYFNGVYGRQSGPLLLLVISIGSILGAPVLGRLFDASRIQRRMLMWCTMLVLAAWLFLLIWPFRLPWAAAGIYYLLLGVSFTTFSMALSEVKDFCPLHMTGTAVGIISAVGFLGSAVFIQIVGGMIGGASSLAVDPSDAVRPVFLLNVIVISIVLAMLVGYEIVSGGRRSLQSDRDVQAAE